MSKSGRTIENEPDAARRDATAAPRRERESRRERTADPGREPAGLHPAGRLHERVGNRGVQRLAETAGAGEADGRTRVDDDSVAPLPRSPGDDRLFRSVAGEGRRLPGPVRTEFESRFGRDLGDVRIHTGEQAARAAEAVGAEAFAVGRDIAFGDGAYEPTTASGRQLLAHELAHVVQQSGSGGAAPGAAAERDATGAASAVGRGEDATVSASTAVGVARQGGYGNHAKTPEELFELLWSQRGHWSDSGAGVVNENRPPNLDEGESMPPRDQQHLGRGNSTHAVITISDGDGNTLLAWSGGASDGNRHAEPNAIARLEREIAARGIRSQLRGAHVMVVVDQEVCSSCRPQLQAFVQRHGMASVTAYNFTRERLVGSGEASPKTSMTGTTVEYAGDNPERPTRSLDFAYQNPDYEGGPPRQPTQQELFERDSARRGGTRGDGSGGEGRRSGSAPGSETGRTSGSDTGRTGSGVDADARSRSTAGFDSGSSRSLGSSTDGMPRQLSFGEYTGQPSVRHRNRLLLGTLDDLDAVLTGVRAVSRAMEIADLIGIAQEWAENFEFATNVLAGEVSILENYYTGVNNIRNDVDEFYEQYLAYSRGLRSIEPGLEELANTDRLDAISDASFELGSVDGRLMHVQRAVESAPTLERARRTKRIVQDKMAQVRRAMNDRTFLSVLGFGLSSAPHAKLVVLLNDLRIINGVLSDTIATYERLQARIEADREFVRTWEDWLWDVEGDLMHRMEEGEQ